MKPNSFVLVLLSVVFAASVFGQAATTTTTPTGYYYPLGFTDYYTGCPQDGGTYLGPDSSKGGCYIPGKYHLGFDMFKAGTAVNNPVFAMESGKVIYIDPNSSWTYNSTTDNTALFVSFSTGSGTSYVSLYGHLLRSSVRVQVGDILNAGTKIGEIGYWNPPHLHLGIWANRTTLPPSPWGMDSIANYPDAHGTSNPISWITATSSSAKCQNGGSAYYKPGGGVPTHPNGTLFTVKGDPQAGTVYVLVNGQTRGIPSADLLYKLYGVGHGFDFRDVMQISMAEFNTYSHGAVLNSPLPMNGRNEPDGRLIKQLGGGEISIVTNNGQRRAFTSAEAFLNLGYQFCNVAGVSDYASYPKGSDISQ